MKLRIGSFNLENLSTRRRFAEASRTETAAAMSLSDVIRPEDREALERAMALVIEDDKRQMSALALAEARADILALQEIDSLRSLEAFFANYVHRLGDARYGHFQMIPGNDRHGIDVAFAARRELPAPGGVRVRSWREATFGDLGVFDEEIAAFGVTPADRVFNRDCLTVDIDFENASFTLFVCHFKSMNNGHDDGRRATMPLRRAEARAVRRIVEEHLGPDFRHRNWAIAGDLNDYVERIERGGRVVDMRPSALDALFDRFAVDPIDRLPPHERWTHFHRAASSDGGPAVEEHVQLDYVLLSPALADRVTSVEIVRRGLPYRAPLDPRDPDRSVARLSTTADRYPRVGWDRPKASDHCPIVVEVDLLPTRA